MLILPSGFFALAWESLFQARAMAKRLYVGNLGYSVTSDQLQALFEQFGAVTSAQVLNDRETGRSRGFGFVEMANDDEAQAAIETLDGNDHDGRRLTVNEARPRAPGGGGPRRGDRGYGGY
jgi:RNA recognition motif-containing protein